MPEIRIPIVGDASRFSKEAAKVDKDLAKIGKQATKTSKEMKSASDRLAGWGKGAVAGVGIGMVVEGLNDATDAALRLNTQVKTSARIFGNATEEIDRVARSSADAFGLSEEAFRLNANRLGGMATNLGYTQREAADLSTKLTGVAADMAAAFGESPERAIEAIGSAMRGEYERIEAFNISLRQSEIDATAMAMGLDMSTMSAQKHARSVATMELIQKQAAKTAGAFGEGVEDGSQKAAVSAAKWENAMVKIGKAIIPVKNGLADLASDTYDVFTGYSDQAATFRDNTIKTTKSIEDGAKAQEYLDQISKRVAKSNAEAALASAFLGGKFDTQAQAARNVAEADLQAQEASERYVRSVRELAAAEGVSYAEAKKLVDAKGQAEVQSQKTTEQLEAEREELRKHIKPVKDVGDAWGDASSAMRDYFDTSTELTDAQNDSKEAWAEAVAALRKNGAQFDWNTGKINTNTEAGRENDEKLKDLARTLAEQDMILAKKNDSVELGTKALAAHREEMIRNMTALGWNREAAEKYLDSIGMVPAKITSVWEQQGLSESIAAAKDLAYWIEKAGGVGGTALAGIARHVDIPRRAAGGGASGPTVVGERGWEIVDLPAGSRVRSHAESVASVAQAGPQVVHAHLHVDGRELASVLIDLAGMN